MLAKLHQLAGLYSISRVLFYKDTIKLVELVKGTVLSNLDEMNVYTKDGQPVDNEQLNKVKVSDTEGAITLTTAEIIHIPLFATGENHRGLSPIEHHKVTLGLASATQIFSASIRAVISPLFIDSSPCGYA